MKRQILQTAGMFIIFILMVSCGNNSSDPQKSSEEVKNKNVVEANTYSVTYSPDALNFEQITQTAHFISSNSVRIKKVNSFHKVYLDETAIYRVEGNYVIIVFPDYSASFEIIENGKGLKSSDGLTFKKQ
jgi:hypothetical protein